MKWCGKEGGGSPVNIFGGSDIFSSWVEIFLSRFDKFLAMVEKISVQVEKF